MRTWQATGLMKMNRKKENFGRNCPARLGGLARKVACYGRGFLATALLLAAQGLWAGDAPAYGAKDDLLPGGAGIALRDDVVFTTTGSEAFAAAKRLVAVDVSTPDAPRMLSYVEMEGFPQDLALSGNVVFVVDGLRLVAVDTTDPAAMKVLSVTLLAERPEFGPQGIAVDGDLAYLACRRQGVVVCDVSNPAAPVRKAVVTTPFSRGVALHRHAQGVYVVSADDTRGLHVIDGERVVSSLRLPRGCAARVRLAGDRVLVANGGSFLAVCRLGDDGKLTLLVDRTLLPGGGYYGSYAYDILPIGGHALLLAGESGVVPVNLSNPAAPVCLDVDGKIPGVPLVRAALLDGSHLYVNGGTMNGKTMLVAMDVADWKNPRRVTDPLTLSE